MSTQAYGVGGGSTDTVANVISFCDVVASSKFESCESPEGTNYVVPDGKTLTITKIYAQTQTGENAFVFGYGDNAVDNAAAEPAGAIELIPTGAILLTTSVWYEFNVTLKIPTGKYPYFGAVGANLTYIACGIVE